MSIEEATKNNTLGRYRLKDTSEKVIDKISPDGNNFTIILKNSNSNDSYKPGDFISISENSELGNIKDTCNPMLLGNHEVISSTDSQITIKGKQTPYIAEFSYGGDNFNFGNCKLKDHYRFSLTGIDIGIRSKDECKQKGNNWIGGKYLKQ